MKSKNILNNKRNKKAALYFAAYTFVFLLMAFFVFLTFKLNGKSLVWINDGSTQHFVSLYFISDILKKFFENPSAGLPLWSWKIGFGSDIVTTLSYYSVGDPLTLLALFVPLKYTENLYIFLILLRFYLAGAAFSLYCFKMNFRPFPVLVGSVIYTFAGFMLYGAIRHPYFANPVIYLPLLMFGIEKIYRKERPFVFIIFVFLSAVSNYYFFYMLSILIILYSLIRFFHYNPQKEGRFLALVKTTLRIAGYYLIGVLLSAVSLLPNLYAFLCCSRNIGDGLSSWLFYGFGFYARFVASFSIPEIGNNWTILIFPSVCVMTAAAVIFGKRKWSFLKISLITTGILLLLPAAGYVFNGFGYATNRWVFAFGLLVALSAVYIIGNANKLTKNDFKIMSLSLIAYFTISIFILREFNRKAFVSFAFGLLTLTALGLQNVLNKNANFKPDFIKKHFSIFIAAVLIFANIAANAYFLYSPKYMDYCSEFIDSGNTLNLYKQNSGSLSAEINDSGFYRVDKYRNTYFNQGIGSNYIHNNDAMVQGYNGIAEFFSVTDCGISDFYREHDIRTTAANTYYSFDGRTALNAAAGVKYYIADKDSKGFVPFGYRKLFEKGNGTVYENQYFLPLSFAYDSYILRSDYNKLSVLDRQQCMLESAVTDKPVSGVPKKSDFKSEKQNIDFKIADSDGVQIIGKNKWKICKNNASVTLNLNTAEKSETYVEINGVDYDNHKEKKNVTFKMADVKKTEMMTSEDYQYNNGNNNNLVNLGYNENPVKSITVTFDTVGTFNFGSFNVYCVPMKKYTDTVKARQKNILTDIKAGSNFVSGNISADRDEILYLSIPYSKGWKVYVNGKRQELLKANTMFSAVAVKAGKNKIELRYRTPFLAAGFAVSLITLLLLITAAGIIKVRRKKN